MIFKNKKWEAIPTTAFLNKVGEGKQYNLMDTQYIHIFRQKFSAETIVDYHCHNVWEIVIRFGLGIMFAIYPPGTVHCAFGPSKPKGTWWGMLSIKFGKNS